MFLDKARIIRFTMRALLLLEDAYGSVRAAFNALRDMGDSVRRAKAVVDFLYALAESLTRDEIAGYLFSADISDVYGKIIEAMENDMPLGDGKTETDSGAYDWDWAYYTARYRLLMNDEEFWGCTPKRFWKLVSLWNEDHGHTSGVREFEIDEIPGW